MNKPAKNQGMVSGRWYALLRRPGALPVLFASKTDAIQNRDFDEYLVRVHVRPLSLRDLMRGEKALLQARRQKRRSGSIEFVGYEFLRSALLKAAAGPLKRRLRAALAAAQKKPKKGGRRAAAPRLRRH